MLNRFKIVMALSGTLTSAAYADQAIDLYTSNLSNELGNKGLYQFNNDFTGQSNFIMTSTNPKYDEVLLLNGPLQKGVQQKPLYRTEKGKILDMVGVPYKEGIESVFVIEKDKPFVSMFWSNLAGMSDKISLDEDFQPVVLQDVHQGSQRKLLVFGKNKISLIDLNSLRVEHTVDFGILRQSNYTVGHFTQTTNLEIALLQSGRSNVTIYEIKDNQLLFVEAIEDKALSVFEGAGLQLSTLKAKDKDVDSLVMYRANQGADSEASYKVDFQPSQQIHQWQINTDVNECLEDIHAMDINQDGIEDILTLLSTQSHSNQSKRVPFFEGNKVNETNVHQRELHLRWIDASSGRTVLESKLGEYVDHSASTDQCHVREESQTFRPNLLNLMNEEEEPELYISQLSDVNQIKASLNKIQLESGEFTVQEGIEDQRRFPTSRSVRRATLRTHGGLIDTFIVTESAPQINEISVAVYEEKTARLMWSSRFQGDLIKFNKTPKKTFINDQNGDGYDDIAFLLKKDKQEKLFAFDGNSGDLINPVGISSNLEFLSTVIDFHGSSNPISDEKVYLIGRTTKGKRSQFFSFDPKTAQAKRVSAVGKSGEKGNIAFRIGAKNKLKPCLDEKLCLLSATNLYTIEKENKRVRLPYEVLDFVTLNNGNLLLFAFSEEQRLFLVEVDKSYQPIHQTPFGQDRGDFYQLEQLENGHIAVMVKEKSGQTRISQFDLEQNRIVNELLLKEDVHSITSRPSELEHDSKRSVYIDSQFETSVLTDEAWAGTNMMFGSNSVLKVSAPKGVDSYDFTKSVVSRLPMLSFGKLKVNWTTSQKVNPIQSKLSGTSPLLPMMYSLINGEKLQGKDKVRAMIRDEEGSIYEQVDVLFDFTNEAPTANNMELEVLNFTPMSKQLPAEDAEGGVLTFAVEQPSSGTVVLDDASTGAFTFTPDQKNPQNTSFTYTVTDNQGFSSEGTVTLTQNTAPQLVAQTFQMKDKRTGTGVVKAEDTQKDSMSFVVKVQPKQGEVKITKETGEFTLQSATDVNTDVTFTVEVTDEHEMKSDVVITLKAIKVTTPPVVTPDTGDGSEPTTPPVVTPDKGDGSEPTTPPVVTPDTGNESEPTTPPVVTSNTDDESNTDKKQPSNETKPETKSSHSGGSMFYAFGLLPLVLRRKRQ